MAGSGAAQGVELVQRGLGVALKLADVNQPKVWSAKGLWTPFPDTQTQQEGATEWQPRENWIANDGRSWNFQQTPNGITYDKTEWFGKKHTPRVGGVRVWRRQYIDFMQETRRPNYTDLRAEKTLPMTPAKAVEYLLDRKQRSEFDSTVPASTAEGVDADLPVPAASEEGIKWLSMRKLEKRYWPGDKRTNPHFQCHLTIDNGSTHVVLEIKESALPVEGKEEDEDSEHEIFHLNAFIIKPTVVTSSKPSKNARRKQKQSTTTTSTDTSTSATPTAEATPTVNPDSCDVVYVESVGMVFMGHDFADFDRECDEAALLLNRLQHHHNVRNNREKDGLQLRGMTDEMRAELDQQLDNLLLPPLRIVSSSTTIFQADPRHPNLPPNSCCANCGVIPSQLRKCAQCKVRRYCTAECQHKHWLATHKVECKNYKSVSTPIDSDMLQTVGKVSQFSKVLKTVESKEDKKQLADAAMTVMDPSVSAEKRSEFVDQLLASKDTSWLESLAAAIGTGMPADLQAQTDELVQLLATSDQKGPAKKAPKKKKPKKNAAAAPPTAEENN